MRWRLRERKAARVRRVSETRAEVAEREVKRPLRQMRQRNHLAEELVRLLQSQR